MQRGELGFGVQGSGVRVQGPMSRVQGSGFRIRVGGPGFMVHGSGFWWFMVQGSGFRVWGFAAFWRFYSRWWYSLRDLSSRVLLCLVASRNNVCGRNGGVETCTLEAVLSVACCTDAVATDEIFSTGVAPPGSRFQVSGARLRLRVWG